MHNHSKSLLSLVSYFVLGALVFHRALGIGIMGDFAADICGSQGNWFNFGAYQWNFYVPAMAVYYTLNKIFHINPLPYHTFHLFMIIINAYFLYLLAQNLEFEPWQCWIIGLLSLFNAVASESYLWLSTIPKVLATTFSLLALISLVRFRQNGAQVWGWCFLLLLLLGVSMESTALILPLLGLFLDFYCQPHWAEDRKDPKIFNGWRIHIWSFGFAGIFLLLRQLLGVRPYVVNLPLIEKIDTFKRTIVNTFFHGLPDYAWILINNYFYIVNILVVFLLVLLVLTWKINNKAERRLFLVLLLLWAGSCLPHTLGANIASRYFYFPGIFAALVLGHLLRSLYRYLHASRLANVLICLIVMGYLVLDIRGFHLAISSYLDASHIYNAGLEKIRTSLPEIPRDSHLILMDFPDYLYTRQASPESPHQYPVLVYRNALPAHLILLYKHGNFRVTFLRFYPPNYYLPRSLGDLATPEQMAPLRDSPKTFGFQYLPGNPGHFIMIGNNR